MMTSLLKTLKRCAALVLALSFAGNIVAQSTTIKGTVKDVAGNPIIGASVTVEGTSAGTATGANGEWELRLTTPPTSTILKINYLGYVAQTITVGSRTTIDVVLEEDAMKMDDLVVIGYGTITKRSLSTAVSTVEGEQIANMPTSNIAQSLVGLSSGITFQQISGQPGSAPAIRIRGAGSINSGNDPLYVIDGMPTTDSELFTNLNPSDVEDIQILKDAASSAIYGSRAGNGVIIVTTKQGKAGKPQITVSTQVGISQVQRYVDVLGADDYLDMIIEARTNNGTIGSFQNLIALRQSGNYEDVDWQKEVFRNAVNFRANVGINGGSETVRYSLSANYLNEDGILLNSFNERIGIKGAFEAQLGKYVNVGASFAPTYNHSRSQNPGGGNTDIGQGIVAQALTMPPIIPVYQPNGDYSQITQHYSEYGLNTQLHNPVSNLLELNNNTYSLRSLNNLYINVRPIKGLNLRSSVNFTTNSRKTDNYRSAYMNHELTGNLSTPNTHGISASRSAGFSYNLYWSNTVSYEFSLNEVHNFNLVAGYDAEYNSGFSVTQNTRTDKDNKYPFTNTNITNVNGAELWTGSSSNTEYAFDAVFGRVNYDYKNKYVASASVRRDRSSKFGIDNRAGIFYSGSLAWNISEEAWAQADWLSIAKMRVSYGKTGNDQIGNNYAWLSSLGRNHNVVFGESVIKGYYPNGYSNADLGWETNEQWDLGFDLGLFNKLNITVDLYKRNSDVVMGASIPNFNGMAGTIQMNSGEVENRGIEIQVTSPILTGDFKWRTNLNWSKNRNEIVKLADGQTKLTDGGAGKWGGVMRNYVGRPMGDMYMLKVIGTFDNEEELANNPKFNAQAVGDLMFEDYNKDGKIDTNDFQLVGNYQPDFTFGWSNNFSYKNFDLVATIDGQVGGEVIYAGARAFTLNRYDDNVLAESGLGRWKSEQEPGNGKSHRAGTNNLGSNINASTRYLYSSDFLRIRNVALGYTFPKELCQKLMLEGLRLSVNVQNLFTFTDYPGYSVEANNMGNSATNNGVDFGNYPASRVITFGANFNF